MNPQHDAVLRLLLTNKIHLPPGSSGDRPAGTILRHVVACLRPWNTRLLAYWAQHPKGHLAIGQAQGYRVGPQTVGKRTLINVAWVGVEDAIACAEALLRQTAHIVDHLLGCDGATDGPWLSDGGGLTEAWRRVGQHIQSCLRLGYGPPSIGPADGHAYFAWGFALYWHDRRTLNVSDPLLERLLRTTLFSDDFWRSAPLP